MTNRRELLKSLVAIGAAAPHDARAQATAAAGRWQRPRHHIGAAKAEPLVKHTVFPRRPPDLSRPPTFE